jgi:hypothetical protein
MLLPIANCQLPIADLIAARESKNWQLAIGNRQSAILVRF